jgi:hypothetical protein
MSIEVRDGSMKMTIQQDTGGQAKPGASGSNNSVAPNEEILQTVIEKLTEIIKNKYER